MGILDAISGGGKKEIEELRAELNNVKRALKTHEGEKEVLIQKNLGLIDKTHAFMQKLKLLVGTLEDEYVIQRCWDLLENSLGVKKGAILKRSSDGWIPDHAVGFKDGKIPLVPLTEESMVGYSAEHGVPLSLAHLKKQDDLAFLERRGVIPDVRIVCPVRVRGGVERLIIICQYAGNVFSGDDDQDIVQMVATVLGLVITNSEIVAAQRAELDQRKVETQRLRNMFSRMVSPEIISFIEKNPGGIVLGGNRQEIAILFADIRGFTSLSEKETPERVIELLNQFFTMITDIVIQAKGTLDKFMGDAAMVLFGTPVCLENPALSAVRTAMKIQGEVRERLKIWQASGYPPFGVGIGINFQSVVVGNVGSERLSSFTAIGDGVNLASRLCGLAKAGEVVISRACREKTGDWKGPVEERHGITVKGKSEPITVYVLKSEEETQGHCPQCGAAMALQAKFCGGCGFRKP